MKYINDNFSIFFPGSFDLKKIMKKNILSAKTFWIQHDLNNSSVPVQLEIVKQCSDKRGTQSIKHPCVLPISFSPFSQHFQQLLNHAEWTRLYTL